MAETRIDPTTVASAAENQRLASVTSAVSPTGTPLLPPGIAPWATVIVALAALAPLIPGIPAIVITICSIVVAIGAAVGIASPGLRRAP